MVVVASIALVIFGGATNSSKFSVDFFFFQAEDGIRDAQESRGLGDVYKRQSLPHRPQ